MNKTLIKIIVFIVFLLGTFATLLTTTKLAETGSAADYAVIPFLMIFAPVGGFLIAWFIYRLLKK